MRPTCPQRSQLGSGNTLNRERSRIPKSSPMAVDRVGIPDGEGIAAATSGRDTGDDEVVATHAAATKILYFAATDAERGALAAAAAAREEAGSGHGGQ